MRKCGARQIGAAALAILAATLVISMLTISMASRSRANEPRPLVIYAAGSLKNVIDEAMARWRTTTGRPVVASYSHAPALAKQIESGAPADIFISADNDWMDYLVARDLVDARSRADVAGNNLVLIAASDDKVQFKLTRGADLAGLVGEDRVAVCTIASCPGGKYAKAALEGLGIWHAVKTKLIDQETIRVALAAVARKEVRFAIVYASDAAIEPRVRVVDVFPESSHPPIVYPAAIVKGPNTDPRSETTRAFLDFLLSSEGSAIFVKHGFRKPARQERK